MASLSEPTEQKSEVLFTPLTIGGKESPNRFALCPMTRGRAILPGNLPADISVEYYRSYAAGGMGLIITEGTLLSPEARGWYRAPGIWTDEQVEKWQPIVEAVHAEGALFCLQLWHTGRQGHSRLADGVMPVSASAIAITSDTVYVDATTKVDHEVPHALTIEEIQNEIRVFGDCTENSFRAGFDFVEIHGANGYLIDQFMQSTSNIREDEYGGSIDNRLRFMREVVEECIRRAGGDAQKIGIRFSPNGTYGDMGSEDGIELFTKAIEFCGEKGLAYVHVKDGLSFGYHEKHEQFTLERARNALKNIGAENTVVIGACGHTKESATEQIGAGHADMIAFGRPTLNCPDFVKRLQNGDEMPPALPHKYWFKGDEMGYINLPLIEEEEKPAEST